MAGDVAIITFSPFLFCITKLSKRIISNIRTKLYPQLWDGLALDGRISKANIFLMFSGNLWI